MKRFLKEIFYIRDFLLFPKSNALKISQEKRNEARKLENTLQMLEEKERKPHHKVVYSYLKVLLL